MRGSTLGRLADLTGGRVLGDPATVVIDASHDSRRCGPGCLFVAVPGARQDGHQFAAAAIAAGAAAVCVDHPLEMTDPQLLVEDTRAVMGRLAAEIHGHPSRRLQLVGVTGTTGKTTVTHLLESIGLAAGITTGLIGTVETRVDHRRFVNTRTTPEATDLHRLLAEMVKAGAGIVATEVSSHALALGRVDQADFAVGAFTNLGNDHLDFHGDLESYFRCKARLFVMARKAVIWVDDPHGRRLAEMIDDPLTVGEGGEVRGEGIETTSAGSRFHLFTPAGSARVNLPLTGRFNVANALVAAGCAHLLGIDLASTIRGLEAVAPVPGRFQMIAGTEPLTVVVDYAHTPEGIAATVATARELALRHVIAVVGAGGDRDRSKRPLMGAAAASADLVVATSDNPRSEDPERILDQVLAGVGATAHIREPDRRKAIRMALTAAAAGDVVLILGKGHEQGQEIGGQVLPFDDRLVAVEELASLRSGAGAA